MITSLFRITFFIAISVGLLVLGWIAFLVWMNSHVGLAVAMIGGTLLLSTIALLLFFIGFGAVLGIVPWYRGNFVDLLRRRELYAVIGYFVVLIGTLVSAWGFPAFREEYIPYVYFSIELGVLVFLELSVIASWISQKKLKASQDV